MFAPPNLDARLAGSLPARQPELVRALPFLLIIAGIAFDSAVQALHVDLPWDIRWDYAARNILALVAAVLLAPWLPELRAPRDGRGRMLAACVLSLAVGLVVLLIWIAAPMQAFSLSTGGFDAARLVWHRDAGLEGSGFTPLAADGHLLWGLAATRLAGSALAVPIAEELFWRSLAMRWIDHPDFTAAPPQSTSLRALALQALAFGLEHDLWLAGIIAGLAYGALYRRSGTLWTAIGAHACTNALLGVWIIQTQQWSYW